MIQSQSKLEKNRPDGSGLRIAIIASLYNDEIVSTLCDSAMAVLKECGVAEKDMRVVRVPGAYEIPLLAQNLAPNYDALLVLGCVIRGETQHFEQVIQACCSGVQRVMLEQNTPIAYGVLAVDTVEQAWDRARDKYNRGKETALAAVKMACLMRRVS